MSGRPPIRTGEARKHWRAFYQTRWTRERLRRGYCRSCPRKRERRDRLLCRVCAQAARERAAGQYARRKATT